MDLTVFSSKRCWKDDAGNLVTIGGFPQQIKAIAELFDRTELCLPLEPGPAPSGAVGLAEPGLDVKPLQYVPGSGWSRRAALVVWLARNSVLLVRTVRKAQAVHTPVPGDIGAIAMILAWALRKPLFVRHCGTWGNKSTLANRFLAAFLPRIAGKRTVVMATGGDGNPPSSNSEIEWVFATTMTELELAKQPTADLRMSGTTLRLVTVARLTRGKNVEAIIEALHGLQSHGWTPHLTVIGDGPYSGALKERVRELGLADLVQFCGYLEHEQVLATLGNHHAFIFPTRVAEGFPKAVVEAMACGLPVVATGVSVIPGLLGAGDPNQECGVLLDMPTAECIEASVAELASDPERMRVMGERAHQRAKGFSLEVWRDLIRERLERSWKIELDHGESASPQERSNRTLPSE